MARNVFDNRQVAHVWASMNQENGRSNNGQFFFTGRTIYSYGSHFPCAVIMPDDVALITTESHSITTAKHMSFVRNAVTHFNQHHLPDLRAIVELLPRIAAGQAPDWQKTAVRQYIEKHALALTNEAGQYLCDLIGAARSWGKIQREAQKAHDKAQAEKAKKESALATHKAQTFAARVATPQGIAAWIAQESQAETWGNWPRPWGGKQYRKATLAEDMARATTEARRHARADKLKARELQAIKAAIKAGAQAVKRFERNAELSKDLAAWRNAKDACRAFGPNYAELPRGENRAYAEQLARLVAIRPTLGNPAMRAALAAALQAAQAREMEFKREEQARLYAEECEAREEWLSGGNPRRHYSGLHCEHGGALLRAVNVQRDDSGRIIEGTLETSRGAKAPLVDALRVYGLMLKAQAQGRAIEPHGAARMAGHFKVTSINEAGNLVIGCHEIYAKEAARLAQSLAITCADIPA